MADTRLSTRISEVGLDALEEQSEPVGTITRATARTRMPDTRMSEVGLETLDEVELAPTASASQHTLQSSRSATPGDQAPEQDAKREAGTPHVPREREAWSSWLFNENGSLRAKAVLAAGTMVLLLVMVAMMIQNTNPLDSDPFKGRAAPFSGVFFGVGIAAFCAYNYYRYGQTREAITRSLLPTSAAPSSSSSRRARAHPRDAAQVQNDRVRRRSRPATNVQADLNATTLQFAFPRKSAPVRATGISCER